MAGFKKKLPMSAALRPGGFGTVAPDKPESKDFLSGMKGTKSTGPSGPTKLGRGVPLKPPKFNKGGRARGR